jgi:4,5-DOPA dioxygenase extradiol
MIPAIFIGHGSPMNAIQDDPTTQKWVEVVNGILKPTAIVVISAHWLTKGTMITGASSLKTIHDFGGFPEELFAKQYPASGHPELAEELAKILGAKIDTQYGLDHGAWSILAQIYPKADIPVVQLSLDYAKTTEQHFELAKKLIFLRDLGVLILGSGNIVHNLGLIDWTGGESEWAVDFNQKIVENIQARNLQNLINYERYGEIARKSVPTPEHYWPLIYVIGASKPEDKIEIFNNEVVMGSLSMTCVKFG